MKQAEIAKWLKGITMVLALMGIVFFFVVMPMMAGDVAEANKEAAFLRWPGIIYGWGIGVLCYAVLFWFWKVCVEIGRDNSFSKENANSFKMISRLTLVMAVVWFVGLVVLQVGHFVNPFVGIFMILAMLISMIIAIMAAALSHLILKAYELKLENELTI